MKKTNEVSPPGWGGTTSAMKKHHPKIKNPWALAWSMKNKGNKPHYKDDPEGTKSKKEPKKKSEFKDEDKHKKLKFKEWLEESFNQELARVAHSAITKMGYGLGRPRVQGDNLVYNTADPEDAEMIAGDIPQQLAKWGIEGKAIAQGINIIVTLNA